MKRSDFYFTHNNNGRWFFLHYGVMFRDKLKRVSARRFHKLYDSSINRWVSEYPKGSRFDFILFLSKYGTTE